MIIYHQCYECGHEEELLVINGQVQCPKCDTINDVWLEGTKPPKRHKELESKFKTLKKILNYGKTTIL